NLDVTVGGSLERHVIGALADYTFLCILTEQFYRTRVGDRFFYENGDKYAGFIRADQLAEICKASMARLLCDNGNSVGSMQRRAFLQVSTSTSCSISFISIRGAIVRHEECKNIGTGELFKNSKPNNSSFVGQRLGSGCSIDITISAADLCK
uniref:Uncharacterized protein n=1 Tax=Glossina brevipalpis TaxID=37001 RepID=A0A1A9WZA6_9MUSC